MNLQTAYNISHDEDGIRLDLYLVQKSEASRSQIQKKIRQGEVLVNEVKTKKVGKQLHQGDIITFTNPEKQAPRHLPPDQSIIDAIKIIDETDEYLIVEKPSGILVHPTQANEPITLTSEILKRNPEIKEVGDSPVRPGIVHRLDKEASGLLVIAKTQDMFSHLKKQFKARTIDKEYAVLVHEFIDKKHDVIDFVIDRGSSGKMVARPYVKEFSLNTIDDIQEGKEAKTEFWVQENIVRYALLRVKIHTGRTHQIRVHMYAYNHPVVGDKLYYNKKLNRSRDRELGRIFLHATKLGFTTLEGKQVLYTSTLPTELQTFLDNLRS